MFCILCLSTAIYCVDCYADLDNVCPVCNKAVQIKLASGSDEEYVYLCSSKTVQRTNQYCTSLFKNK